MVEERADKNHGVLRVDRAIYAEIEKCATDNNLSLREAANKCWFAKLAELQDPKALLADTQTLSAFQIAVKYVGKSKELDLLIKAAKYKRFELDIEYAELKNAKLKDSTKERIIEQIKIYACPTCNLELGNVSDVSRHFQSAHQEKEQHNVLANLCPFCITEKTFSTKSDLCTHINAYHMPKPQQKFEPPKAESQPPQVVVKEIEIIKQVCFCGKMFDSGTDMGIHFLHCDWVKKYREKHEGVRA